LEPLFTGSSLTPPTSEVEVWESIPPEDLWPLDKLILSRHLGYTCGPTGVDVPIPGEYIVRPCINPVGLGVGAEKVFIQRCTDRLPVGHFWCEVFTGRHLSVDYFQGHQMLCVEGFREPGQPFWRWDKWARTTDRIPLPPVLSAIAAKHTWLNVEYIGGNAIECHFRANPDFWIEGFGEIQEVVPVWANEAIAPVDEYRIILDPDFATLGLRRAILVKGR